LGEKLLPFSDKTINVLINYSRFLALLFKKSSQKAKIFKKLCNPNCIGIQTKHKNV
jgi:hypothetical protein